MMNPAENAEGPLLIGIFINAVLLGVMSTQVYIYFTSFKKDQLWMKIFVAFLFLCDIVNTVCDIAALYETLVRHFGDFVYLGEVTWLFDTDPATTGIIVTSTQLFFAWRIFVLTGKRILSLAIVTLALVGGISALITSIKIEDAPMFALLFKVKVPIIVWLSSEVLGDILITTSLVMYLSKHRTGFKQTDMLIDRIIRMTIQTGFFTAIVATIDLFVYLLDPTGLHLIFNFPLCKLYSNSLMSTLNSRGAWMKSSRDEVHSRSNPKDSSNGNISTELSPSFRAEPSSPTKPAAIFDHSTTPQTEVYVNVESLELHDRKAGIV